MSKPYGITNKYNINETYFFISKNKVNQGRIKAINTNEKDILYDIEELDFSSEYFTLKELELFETKEQLLNSL
jgi:hypothetical protein